MTTFADFIPNRCLPGGHVQTLAGIFLPGRMDAYRAEQHIVALDDGDRIVLHDDRPAAWQAGDRTALLIHGLAGCHASPYMRRIAAKLNERGVRTFRMDLRGRGRAGLKLARLPYHSGRSDDAAAAIVEIARLCPASPTTLIGFSLGGNIALKLLGEIGDRVPGNLDSGVAVSPPIDLARCVQSLQRTPHRLYDRYFAWMLYKGLAERRRVCAETVTVDFARRPRGLWEFDDAFTAPVSGFGRAERYYVECSSGPLLARIRLPTIILAAHNDPLVPAAPLETATLSASTQLHIANAGGHLGFIGGRSGDPDRRWMDWRVVEWVMQLPPLTREPQRRAKRLHSSR